MLDTSIAQPMWPALGMLIGLSLLVGAMVGRLFGQWRMFVIGTAISFEVLDSFLRLSPWWTVLMVMGGGMAFYAVAWFRERKGLMGDGDPDRRVP